MFRLFLLTSVGVLIIFFCYKSIVYLFYDKVEGEVIGLEKSNVKFKNVGNNKFSNTRESYSYEPVIFPVISYKYKNQHFVLSNPYWGKANKLKEKDKVTLLIDEKNDEIHLVTIPHFWVTSIDIIYVFPLIFLLTIIFSTFLKEDKIKKPHPLFKD
jgi:hypothetical protein